MRPTLMLFMLLLSLSLASCINEDSDGPYFGNGIHNGWADQHSIVIWTRLTQRPDGRPEGPEFIGLTKAEHDSLRRLNDPDQLNAFQLPEGASLEDMPGACPGTTGEVLLRYYQKGIPENFAATDWTPVNPDENFSVQWTLTNLKPDTKYKLLLLARKNAQSPVSDTLKGSFRTPPKDKIRRPVSFSIVSCHDYLRRDTVAGHKIYAAMEKDKVDFYIHTGDIEYYDKPDPYAFTEELMHFKWDRLFALPLQRNFWSHTTSYFMKDDHDILCDDAYPGTTYGAVDFERGLEIFDREQFPSAEKTYKTIRWGKDLQIWILEGRRYRSQNTETDSPAKTILGQEQKQWLFQTLQESDATIKVIVSASPILGPDRPKGKNDNHSNKAFQTEGDELRAFINRFDNIFLCNGDRHWQYVTHFDDTNLWEFGCGAGTDAHAGGWDPDNFLPQHRFLRVKGGYLLGSVTYENDKPKLSFQHRDVDGNTVYEEIFNF
ncbi:MAG: alkaline phosphatase D family protein [Saprospiraceae bacterium]|nr:alkaline phosphatase D family protein [Lewinella sp.]